MNREIVNEQISVSNEDDSLDEFLEEQAKNWLEDRTREAEETGLSAEAAQWILELHKGAMKGE